MEISDIVNMGHVAFNNNNNNNNNNNIYLTAIGLSPGGSGDSYPTCFGPQRTVSRESNQINSAV
jgi:hypothetical protein